MGFVKPLNEPFENESPVKLHELNMINNLVNFDFESNLNASF